MPNPCDDTKIFEQCLLQITEIIIHSTIQGDEMRYDPPNFKPKDFFSIEITPYSNNFPYPMENRK